MDKEILRAELKSEITDELLYNILKENIAAGNNKLAQTVSEEVITVDSDWLDTIAAYLLSVEKIVLNPKTFIKDVREVVPVEKARRVDAESIRYLASHSEDIRRIDRRGNVEPIRVLAKAMQEDLATYENRVVYTLLHRLKVFLEERYNSLKETVTDFETTNLKMDSGFNIGKASVSYRLDMEIRQRKDPCGKEILERLEEVRHRVRILCNTPFFRSLSSTKLIIPPIQRTNLLVGNPDYNNAYRLWLFISAFRTIGYSVAVSSKDLPFDNDYFDDLTGVVAESLKVLIKNNVLRAEQYKGIKLTGRKVKRYTAYKKSALDTGAGADYNKLVLGGDGINQYYYEKMKALVKSVSKKSTAKDVEDIKRINANFRRFYKGLSKINNALLYDIMKLGAEEKYKSAPADTVLKKKQNELKAQREISKKYSLLVELKEAELESLKAKELSIKQKLRKLEVDVEARLYKEKQKKILKTKKLVKDAPPQEIDLKSDEDKE
ncbi:MAG TPA: DUF2357 domain-containing protein [Clostridia bacterium]|nr:DUF2357 domain-containing protein [Clostridia bacterium]